MPSDEIVTLNITTLPNFIRSPTFNCYGTRQVTFNWLLLYLRNPDIASQTDSNVINFRPVRIRKGKMNLCFYAWFACMHACLLGTSRDTSKGVARNSAGGSRAIFQNELHNFFWKVNSYFIRTKLFQLLNWRVGRR